MYEVIIVGAGPGGLSVAGALLDHGIDSKKLLVLDRGLAGQAWLDYPADTHLLSASSADKDDNKIAGVDTSEVFPNIPHPSHVMYQKYLDHVVNRRHIPVRPHTTVESVVFNPEQKVFVLNLRDESMLCCNHLVWAAGMYSTPNEDMNMEGCYIHYAKMPYLNNLDAKEVTVVGGANGATGIVMAVAQPGRKVNMLVSQDYEVPQPVDCMWKENMVFVKNLGKQGLVNIIENFRVKRIYKKDDTYFLESEDGKVMESADKPIICTGFHPNIEPVKSMVAEYCEDHETRLTLDEHHQSTLQQGLYFAGVIGRLEHDSGFIVSFRDFGEPIAKSILKK